MEMYYITEITSETGKKFAELMSKRKDIFEQQKELTNSLGFKRWRTGVGCISGGFSGLLDPESTPDSGTYKKADNGNPNEYFPKRNTKKGKEVLEKMAKIPRITGYDLNMCLGYRNYFSSIGFDMNEDYCGFIVNDDWAIAIPSDCKEVTCSEYKKIFRTIKT